MAQNWRRRRRTAMWSARSPCCRMPSRPTSGQQSRNGENPRACLGTRWKHSARAVTSSASPESAPRGIHETFLPMPKTAQARPYLAFDFGAESGRAVLAHLQSGILTTEEVHRFPNEPVEYGGSLHWDVARLWFEVRKALAQLGEVHLAGIGVDAWGVDYALLGESGELLENPYHYRDRRTDGAMEEVLTKVSREE